MKAAEPSSSAIGGGIPTHSKPDRNRLFPDCHFTVVTDDKFAWNTLDSIATSKGITFAELMKKPELDVSGSTHLWLDLPLGGRWRATKTDALRDRINSMIKVSQDCNRHLPMLMMVPYGNGKKRVFPYKRWSHLLTKWRPHSETYCSCQYFPEDHHMAKRHLKARIFATQLRFCLLYTSPSPRD